MGDGTTSVVIIAAELLKRANELVKNKIHPTSIMTGYRHALKEVCICGWMDGWMDECVCVLGNSEMKADCFVCLFLLFLPVYLIYTYTFSPTSYLFSYYHIISSSLGRKKTR